MFVQVAFLGNLDPWMATPGVRGFIAAHDICTCHYLTSTGSFSFCFLWLAWPVAAASLFVLPPTGIFPFDDFIDPFSLSLFRSTVDSTQALKRFAFGAKIRKLFSFKIRPIKTKIK